ncbi:hypothetical protein BC829DRAFT_400831 [Chytridium lagenaria]|nr:hypothetical protein BC829DRAFT_400831 [Chytridium lagenaria]
MQPLSVLTVLMTVATLTTTTMASEPLTSSPICSNVFEVACTNYAQRINKTKVDFIGTGNCVSLPDTTTSTPSLLGTCGICSNSMDASIRGRDCKVVAIQGLSGSIYYRFGNITVVDDEALSLAMSLTCKNCPNGKLARSVTSRTPDYIIGHCGCASAGVNGTTGSPSDPPFAVPGFLQAESVRVPYEFSKLSDGGRSTRFLGITALLAVLVLHIL